MGGGIRSKNPQGCCPGNANPSCQPQQCGDHGNLFTDFTSNPYAEFNIFMDPFAAYQVLHVPPYAFSTELLYFDICSHMSC